MRTYTPDEKRLIAFLKDLGVDAFVHPSTLVPETGEPLWRACLRANIFSWGRDSEVELQVSSVGGILRSSIGSSSSGSGINDSSSVGGDGGDDGAVAWRVKRFVVLEAAMAVGLGAVVGEYVTAQQRQTGSGIPADAFLLSDVGTIYNWAAAMYESTAREAFDVTVGAVVPALVHKRSSVCETVVRQLSREPVEEGRARIDAYAGLCVGLLCVLDRLLQRKVLSFELSVGDSTEADVGHDARAEHHSAVADLQQLTTEVAALLGVLRVLALTHDHDVLHLGYISPHCSADYHLTPVRQDRMVTMPETAFLPPALRSDHLLVDVLVNRLPDAARSSAVMPPSANNNAGFYAAVAAFLWLPVAGARAHGHNSRLNAAARLTNRKARREAAAALGQALVIYLLLDMYCISHQQTGNISEQHISAACAAMARDLAGAFDMAPSNGLRVLALWRIDAQLDAAAAVRDCCDPAVALADDTELFRAAVTRLLAFGARGPAKLLLQHSAVTSELVQSATGILALAAASLARDVWKFAWHSARGLCGRLGGAEAVDARRHLAAIFCHWALMTGELGAFLEAAMDADEQDEVHTILADLAAKEVEASAFPAHALDTLVYWLLRLRRISEAKLLHEQHCTSLRARPRTPDFVQRFGDIEARAALIESCAAFSAVPPRELKAIPGRALAAPQPTAEQSFIPASYFLRAAEYEEKESAAMDTVDGAYDEPSSAPAPGAGTEDAYGGITWAARSTSRPTVNLDDDVAAAVAGQSTAMDTTDVAYERVEFAADKSTSANRSRMASLLESSTATAGGKGGAGAAFSRTEPTPSSSPRGSSMTDWGSRSFEQSPAVNLSQLPNP